MSTRTTRASARQASTAAIVKKEPQQLSSPPATPETAKKPAKKSAKLSGKKATKANGTSIKKEPVTPKTPKRGTKRGLATPKPEFDENELPHGLGDFAVTGDRKDENDAKPSPKKRKTAPPRQTKTPRKSAKPDFPAAVEEASKMLDSIADSEGIDAGTAKQAKKKKDNGYGLTPGSTPYPEWLHPTPEECHEVTRLLERIHGKVQMPKAIPTPSLDVAGCGEVPSVLDALIRTRLSAATTGANSSRAFKGLVDTFGVLKEGIGKGSVNWDAVRLADTKAVFSAIKSGGLADVKSKDIKSILQMVHTENQERRESLVNDNAAAPAGADSESKADRDAEVARADSHVLSLDHLHALPSEEAFNQLVKYPGIGPKTASCVLLFCLQRPSFAVDTHVFRLCRYLNWVPPDRATRNSTYAHCEVRVPDELKYPLHQLLIKHGKTCPRCRAATGLGSENWAKGCVIEHLVKRYGTKKGGDEGGSAKKKRAGTGKKKMVAGSEEESEEESELSELESDEEAE